MRPSSSTPSVLNRSTFADLPRFWTAADAQRVFAALDASGLTVGAFARATGLSPTRLGPGYRRRMAVRLGVSLGEDPTPVRLVEVVARGTAQPAPSTSQGRIHVVAPHGWRLEVPGELLGELVRALGVRPC
jgi:hypothetical protein